MKLVTLASIALVLGSITFPPQSSAQNASVVATVVPGSSNCPIDIGAEKNLGAGQFQKLPAKGHQELGPNQSLHLTLTNSTYSKIIGVRVTAYGLNAKGQLTPARSTAGVSSTMQKRFDLKLNVDPKSMGSVDLVLAGFTAVTYLNVDSIQYAGGTAWQPSAQQTCHVIPNGVMLITAR